MSGPGETSFAPTVSGRRYLTILFCDLVGSTELAERLDPEELQQIQLQYHDSAMRVIESFGGFVASFSGDGILAYFGYPIARENDAERAVRASLDVIESIKRLDVTVGRQRLPSLCVRIGIHTGLVVIGTERASGGKTDHAVVGEAVNLAFRLQGEALANGIVVSSDTLQLVEELFDTESLGRKPIKGFTRLVPLFRITGARVESGRPRRLSRRGATRMIGRSSELEQVLQAWTRTVADSRCTVVSIAGEAGVGKTRLAVEACQQPEMLHATLVETHCQEIFANTPLQPVVGFMWSAAGLNLEEPDETKFAKIAGLLSNYALDQPENVALVAELLGARTSAATVSPPAAPAAHKERQFNFLVSLIGAIASHNPTILWIEDAHWLDPSSSELLAKIVKEFSQLPILVLMTVRTFPTRPDLPPADESVGLSQLPAAQCLELARSVPGSGTLSEGDLARAVESAEGNPLFVEQLVLSLIDKGGDVAGRRGLPLSLAELMSERLDRLPSGRRVVQAAACIGRSFTATFLARVLGEPEDEVEATLEALIAAEILKRRPEEGEGAYEFRHALLQRMAHESIALTDRRLLHARIAELLIQITNIGPTLPEFVAHHLTEAARHAEAVQAWLDAGIRAAQRSAHAEAIEHLRRGLALLDEVTDPALNRNLELRLQAALIGPLTATRGATAQEFSDCCRRGLTLCKEGDPTPLIFPFLFGQFVFAIGRGHASEAATLSETFLKVADGASFDSGRVIGYRLSGMAALGLGDASRAKIQLERSLALYDSGRDADATHLFGQNTQVHSRALLSLSLLCLGDIEESLRVGTEALQAADAIRHPHSTAIALGYFGGLVLGWLGVPNEMMILARRLIALAERHNLGPFRLFGMSFLGWALCQKGDLEQGIAVIEPSIKEFDAIEYRLGISVHLTSLADAKRRTGKLGEAAQLCRRAREFIDQGADRWFEPEVIRVEALVARDLDPDNTSNAKEVVRDAVAKAQALRFPLFELRCLDTFREIVGADSAFDARAQELAQYRNLDRLAASALRRRAAMEQKA
jgi:class 3 adenylate cyclase/tetratricopeptide (TPR) repeat protein